MLHKNEVIDCMHIARWLNVCPDLARKISFLLVQEIEWLVSAEQMGQDIRQKQCNFQGKDYYVFVFS